MIGYVLIGISAVLWLGAMVAMLRDKTSGQARRLVTLAILVLTVPIAFFYWRSHH